MAVFSRLFRRPQTPGPYIVAGIAAIVVGGALIYFRGPSVRIPSKEEVLARTAQFEHPPILEVNLGDLAVITVEGIAEPFSLIREGGKWRILSPFSDLADEGQLAEYVSLLTELPTDEILAYSGNDEEYGLDDPLLRVFFELPNGRKIVYAIGQPEDSVEYFIHTSQTPEEVHLVRNLPALIFGVTPTDLLLGQLFDFDLGQAVRIDARIGGEEPREVTVARDGAEWTTRIEDQDVVVFGVNSLLRDLRFFDVSALAAVADEGGFDRFGLDPVGETVHLSVQLQDGQSVALDVGGSEDGRRYFVRSSARPHVYTAVEFTARNLIRKIDLTTPDFLAFNPIRVQQVDVIRVVADDGEVNMRTFNLRDGTWTTEQQAAFRRVAFNVPPFVEAVADVQVHGHAAGSDPQAFRFLPSLEELDEAATSLSSRRPVVRVNLNEASADSLRIRVTLTNRAQYTFDLGAPTPDGRYVHVASNMRDGVFLLPMETYRSILDALADIRLDLLPFSPDEVERIVLREMAEDSESVVRLERTAAGWLRDDGQVLDADAVEGVLAGLRGLQAEAVAKEEEAEHFNFYPAPGSLRVELTMDDGSTRIYDRGGALQEGSSWFAVTNYFVRVDDLIEIIKISDREINPLDGRIRSLMN